MRDWNWNITGKGQILFFVEHGQVTELLCGAVKDTPFASLPSLFHPGSSDVPPVEFGSLDKRFPLEVLPPQFGSFEVPLSASIR